MKLYDSDKMTAAVETEKRKTRYAGEWKINGYIHKETYKRDVSWENTVAF